MKVARTVAPKNLTSPRKAAHVSPRGSTSPEANARSTFETTRRGPAPVQPGARAAMDLVKQKGQGPAPVRPGARAAVDLVKQKLSDLGVPVTPRTLAEVARLTVAAAAANPDATARQLASIAAEQLAASERARNVNRTLRLLAAQFQIPTADKGALAAFVREQAAQLSAQQLLANVETPLAQLDLLPFGAIADYCEKQGWPMTGGSDPVAAAFG